MAHEKDISPERQAEFDRALTTEAMSRDDLGVGQVWRPECGGKRSAAIYVEGVTSFAALEMEMDALAGLAAKAGVKEPAIHFVFSFSPAESLTLTAEQKVEAARAALYEMGLREHAKYLTLHVDKPHHHIHAAVVATSPATLLAWERHRDRFRISHACRTVEIAQGFLHDPGLYMARVHDDGTKNIELATLAERLARKAERQQDHLENRVRRTLGDYASFETAESWKETVVARLHEHAAAYRDAGIEPFWADAHLIAAQWNGRLRQDDSGAVHLDLWERVPEDEIVPRQVVDEHGEPAVIPGLEMRPAGISLPIEPGELPFPGDFVDFDAAEGDFEQRVRADVTIVGRALTDVEGRGMWSRADVDAFVHRRHSDVITATDLSDHIIDSDKTIAMTAADASRPMYVRLDQQALEQRVVDRADRMAAAKGEPIDMAAFRRGVARFQKAAGHALTREQRLLIEAIAEHRFVWANGSAGAGKSTSMRAAAEVAAEFGLPIVGLATSKAAAAKLEAETGIRSYTLARAMFSSKALIAPGSWVIVDESSMSSYKALDAIGALVERHGGKLIGIGDGAQIPSIEGGSPHDALCAVAKRTGTYVELRGVWRQRGGPLAYLASNPKATGEAERLGLIALAGEAIRAGNEAGVERFVRELDRHGLLEQCEDRDAVVRAAAAWYVASSEPTLLACKDRETVKHVNGTIRELLGLDGTGESFSLGRSGRETRELAVGDRVQFLRNSRAGEIQGGSVDNNDLGTVRAMRLEAGRWTIEVAIDARERQPATTISFDPKAYHWVEHGYVVTSHKSQGQEFARAGWIWDKTSDANMALVNASRAVAEARGFFSERDFPAVSDLATHLGDHIIVKDDVQLLYRTIEKTGGKETTWARNAIAALQSISDPLRQQYVRECHARDDAYRAQMVRIHETARALRENATSPDERAAAAAWHAAEARKTSATVRRQPTFAEWLVIERARIERDAELAEQARDQRERFEARRAERLEKEQRDLERLAAAPVQTERVERAIEGCVPITGTAGEMYLRGRGLAGPIPDGVLWAPNFYQGCTTANGGISRGLGAGVVFVVRDERGAIVAAQARLLSNHDLPMFTVGEVARGTFSTPGAREADTVAIVESPIDAISLAEVGVPAIALCGSMNRPAWLRQTCVAKEVILAGDDDRAGRTMNRDLRDLLAGDSTIVDLRIPAGCKDANDAHLRSPDALRAAVQRAQADVRNTGQRAWRRAWQDALGTEPPLGLERALEAELAGELDLVSRRMLDKARSRDVERSIDQPEQKQGFGRGR